MARLPAIRPKGMTEGKLGQAASKQKPITVPTPKRRTPPPGKVKDDRVIKEPRTKDDKVTTKSKSTSKTLTPFGTAFSAARKAGKATFTFRGKKYTTKVK